MYKTTCFGLFYDHLQGVLRCALCRYYSSRWFAFVEFVLLRSMWTHVYVICVCLVFLSVGDLHSGGPAEDGREKRPKHVGILYLQTRF
jgi:hypothetical protein